MKRLLHPILFCLPLTFACADSIELKDGTKIDGKILRVTDDAVLVEVQTSPTIRGEKAYPRSEVAKIRRSSIDDLAFEEIAGTQPPGTADNPAAYDALLEPLRIFMKNYPYSRHMTEARRMTAVLESERARLSAGEVKVDGAWIAADTTPAGGTELEGRVLLSKMKASTDPAAALAAFEVLEKEHPTSSSYPEAVQSALSSIEKLRASILRARADLERRTREQEEGLKLASEDRRLQMEAAIAREKAATQEQIDRVKKSGGKWLPVLPDADALADLSATADSEETRLSAIDTAKMSGAVEAARAARERLDAGDAQGAKAGLDKAQELWPQLVLLVPLKESLDKAQEAAKPSAP